MAAYSPFQKPLSAVDVLDLPMLNNVSEGWYVEYKGELSKSRDIAKSVSAFANTYGGLVFYGVSEKSKDDPVAGTYPGIERSQVDASLQTVRHAIGAHLNPAPHFDVKVLWGPHDAIGLGNNRAVIAVYVPWSVNTPHIHSSGRIYRRVGDGTDPRPEADRYALDQLQNRSKKLGKEYAKWVGRNPEFSRDQAASPFLRLMIVADLWGDRELWCDLTLKQFRELIVSRDPKIPGIFFGSTYSSSTGFVARDVVDNNPALHVLTWRMNRRLVSDILIPVNCYGFDGTSNSLRKNFSGFDHGDRFSEILIRQGYNSIRVLDMNILFNVIYAIIQTQERFFEEFGWKASFFAKGHLLNAQRTCPFIDIDSILTNFEEHGTPVCLDKKLEILPGTSPESFVEIKADDTESREAKLTVQAGILFGIIATALGVPTWTDLDAGHQEVLATELIRTGTRALEAQTRRNRNASRS